MNELDGFKSKITFENKTTIGIVGIVLAFVFWGIGHPNIGVMDCLILIFPAILLVIPSESIKNNRILGIIALIILALFLLVGISALIEVITYYIPDSWAFSAGYVEGMFMAHVLQLILCLYGMFCAFLLTVQTSPSQTKKLPSSNNKNFDKYCSNCGQGLFNDSQFCSKCGTKLTNEIQEDSSQDDEEKNNENVCSECGYELDEESIFCPECGVEVTDEIQEDSSQDDVEEINEKVCSACGHELNDDSKFCPECGAEVSTSNEETLDK